MSRFVIENKTYEIESASSLKMRLNEEIRALVRFEVDVDGTVYSGKTAYKHRNKFLIDGLTRLRYSGGIDKYTGLRFTEEDVKEDICCWIDTMELGFITKNEDELMKLEEVIRAGELKVNVYVEYAETEEYNLYSLCEKIVDVEPEVEKIKREIKFIDDLYKKVENDDDKMELITLSYKLREYLDGVEIIEG